MKRMLGITLAILLVLTFTLPAMAADVPNVDTAVTVVGGTTGNPQVKCKWEATSDGNVESGDPTHLTPGMQMLPPGTYQGTRPIIFWAVVTDTKLGIANIRDVYVDVYHPARFPLNGSFKFQKQLLPFTGTRAEALATFNAAYAAGLVTINAGFTLADIQDQLNEGLAVLYRGEYFMYYCQPAGDYKI